MIKAGAIILSIGWGFQCLVSILSLIFSMISNAPVLRMIFSEHEIAIMNTKFLATTKSLGILHNSGAVLTTLLSLIIIWTSLINGEIWAFWTLLLAGTWGHLFWYLSDSYIGYRTFVVNITFAMIFVIGISLVGYGFFK
jgi:hypothetical protein